MISMLRKEACSGSIHDLAHVPTQNCLADCLTKASAKVLGFGGKANPLVYASIASLAARARQALLNVQCGRLQLHVGDSAVVVVGDEQAAPLGTQTVVA